MKNTNPYNTNYDSSVYQAWSNGFQSQDGARKADSLSWCTAPTGEYKGASMWLGFDTAEDRDAFVAATEGAEACKNPARGDPMFYVCKNRGPYTCGISCG